MIRSLIFLVLTLQLNASVEQNMDKVEEQMKREIKACLDAQIVSDELYEQLNDKSLSSYQNIPEVRVFKSSIQNIVKQCKKVAVFHKDVEQAEHLIGLLDKVLNKLEIEKENAY